MKTDKQERAIAMLWWNAMSSDNKTRWCDSNTDIVGSTRRWETLTGREIELIYKSERRLYNL
jgi:hypothetical protein